MSPTVAIESNDGVSSNTTSSSAEPGKIAPPQMHWQLSWQGLWSQGSSSRGGKG